MSSRTDKFQENLEVFPLSCLVKADMCTDNSGHTDLGPKGGSTLNLCRTKGLEQSPPPQPPCSGSVGSLRQQGRCSFHPIRSQPLLGTQTLDVSSHKTLSPRPESDPVKACIAGATTSTNRDRRDRSRRAKRCMLRGSVI